jgi:hypothetical protein
MTFVNMYIFIGRVQLYIISKLNIKAMKKSNLVVFLSLLLLVIPLLKLQAEGGSLGVDSSIKVESSDDKYPLPPVPLPKPTLRSNTDVRGEIELGDDKGGLRESNGESTDDRKISPQAEAMKDGMITMQLDGFIKALRGQTTIEEILRVTSEK